MDSLATELLHELKRSSKRNFILAVILLIALVGSNIAWLIYESQWEELEAVCQDMKEQARKLEDIAEMSKNPQERAMLMKISQTEKDHLQGLKKIVES